MNDRIEMGNNVLILGDCLDVLPTLEEDSVDMVLADIPYNVTQNAWDKMAAAIPLNKYVVMRERNRERIFYEEEALLFLCKQGMSYKEAEQYFKENCKDGMWEYLKRIVKPNGAIVMTAAQPFTTTLINSNRKMFKYCWVWEKNKSTGYLNANRMPLNSYEDVCVFYRKLPTYNPQYTEGTPYSNRHVSGDSGSNYGDVKESRRTNVTTRYPRRNIQFDVDIKAAYHPTQKPVSLMSYLISTYTNKGDTVLDFAAGSFTTGVAAAQLDRCFIGIEKEKEYFDVGVERITAAQKEMETL